MMWTAFNRAITPNLPSVNTPVQPICVCVFSHVLTFSEDRGDVMQVLKWIFFKNVSSYCLRREEIPPKENQWEEATHQRVYSQTPAVQHLENGERVLRVCTWAVPVRSGSCGERKRRRTLPSNTELFLWENLPQNYLRLCDNAVCCGQKHWREDTFYFLWQTHVLHLDVNV